MAAKTFDMIVIGAGPGGYVCAIRGAQLGLSVAIVEREHMGGICLNWGCIPTKAMLRSSEVFHLMHRAKEFGLKAEGIGYDLDAVVKRSRGVAKQLNAGVTHLMKKNKVTVFMGAATLTGKGKVSRQDRQGHRGARSQEHRARHRRPRARAPGARGRRRPRLDLQARPPAAADAEEPPRHRLGRHRHRIRELLQHARRQDDRGRGDGPHPARGGRRGLRLRQEGVREAGDGDPPEGHREEARPREGQGHRPHRTGRQDRRRATSTPSSPPSASSATWRTSGSRRWA